MSSLVFPGLDVADAGPTPLRPAAAALTDPPALGGGFSSAGPGDDDSSESSSIGSPSSDDDDGDEDRGSDGQGEAGSNSNKDGSTGSGSSSSSLGSLSSLEDSLPIKRGLSNHFAGKSRSFSNLSECAGANVGDLVKHENPFNKRRRIQIVNSISYKRRASCSSLITTLLPPLLSPEHALQEEEEEEEDEDDENDEGNVRRSCFPTLHLAPHGARFYKEAKMKKAALKSPRSFPLFEDLRYV